MTISCVLRFETKSIISGSGVGVGFNGVYVVKKAEVTAEIKKHYAGASLSLATSLKGASVIVF